LEKAHGASKRHLDAVKESDAMSTFNPARAARFIADAHAARTRYTNLPEAIAPRTVSEAYAAQEALRPLWEPLHGPVAGLKIATTTKVMQQLMGIDHPCGGMIYQRRVHTSPATIRLADFRHCVIECELAVRLKAPLGAIPGGHTRESVRAAIGMVMPAFELIEDRDAVYKETSALSLIADNAWNGGIVLGTGLALPTRLELDGIAGRLHADGRPKAEGKTDDPLGALAWVANLAIERGRPMQAGMVVITGSCIPTLPIAQGETFTFSLAGLGTVEMSAA
jgi:2-keto-4-pentenoate hydratase